MTFPFAAVAPAFKYVATGKRVPEKDFSTLGKLFSDKKAVSEFLDLWCSAEIVRDVFFEGTLGVDLHEAHLFNDVVATAVSEYHMRYGLVPNVLAWRDLMEGEIAVVNVGGEKFYPPVDEFSCKVSVRTDGYQGDRFMAAVRSVILGFVNRDDEVLLHLFNQTESDVTVVSPETCTGSFPVTLFATARNAVWEQAIAVPSMVTTPHVLRDLYQDSGNFFGRPTSLTGARFGVYGGIEMHIVEPSKHSANYALGCGNIDKGALYALGSPSILGIRHVKVPLTVHPASVDDESLLFVWARHSTCLQSKAVGKARAQL